METGGPKNLFDRNIPPDFLDQVDEVLEESDRLARVLRFPTAQLVLFETVPEVPPDDAA